MQPKKREAFILQEVETITVDDLISKSEIKNTTVMIPEVGYLRAFSRQHLLAQKRLLVPEKAVGAWGLREGDKVTTNEDLSQILNVNGLTTEQSRNRPVISGARGVLSDYAKERIPVEEQKIEHVKGGRLILKTFTLRAPFGKGQRLFIAAPPETGKTWTMRALFEACLRITNIDKKLYVIGVQVGERAEDAKVMKTIKENTLHAEDRSELYFTPDGDPPEAHFYVTHLAIERARRLCECGYDVVIFIDSMSRVLMSHSRSMQIPKPPEDGMIAKGLRSSSAAATKDMLAVAGTFKNGSLTIVATMLKDGFRKSNSSEIVLFDETGPSTSTSIWALTDHNKLESVNPKIDIYLTRSRQYDQICTPEQLKQMELAQMAMWRGAQSDPIIACQNLIEFAKSTLKEGT